mmetsp:Transcript_5234/g.5355  ORF Transcript_5234/g.5355 Transcript_5234/m.5355 type:complete len:419 (+) Transcript_5234:1184-2440(+)
MNNGQLSFPLFENKNNVEQIPRTKIVEAYGLQKCPKLVEQVADDELAVRVNALAVVCDEFRNPYVIQGCSQAGIIKILAAMIVDPDHTTRVRSSRALCLAATDANGLEAILYDEVIPEILQGMNDQSTDVRKNVYECLYHTTRTMEGVQACVRSGVTTEFVQVLMNEEDELKPYILKTIHNTCKIEEGLQDALSAHAVEILIELLRNTLNTEVTLETAKTLGFLCYSDEAKISVIKERGVTILMTILKEISTEEVKLAITFALMAITSHDESKIELCDCDGISILISTLLSSQRLVQLNILKIISNVAVYPPGRYELNTDTRGYEPQQLYNLALESKDNENYYDEKEQDDGDNADDDEGKSGRERKPKVNRRREILIRTPHVAVNGVIKKLHDTAVESGDNLMAKHALIALQAVQWTP